MQITQSFFWVKELDLKQFDRDVIETGGMLSDRHMYAVHKMLAAQFPQLQGLQSTLLPQTCGFSPILEHGGFIAAGM